MSRAIRNPVKVLPAIIEELEPRLLLSADGLAGLDSLVSTQERDFDESTPVLSLHTVLASVEEREAGSNSVEEAVRRQELVFVDGGIANYQSLVDEFLRGTDSDRQVEVFVLESNRDGIEQITQTLAMYSDVDAVHVLSHGQDGALQLGSAMLDGNSLDIYREAIAGWGVSLDAEADLLFYGCNLAAGEDGRMLIRSLADLTGADVAASDDLTGSALLGGDWELEHRQGLIETLNSGSTDNTWFGVLNDPVANDPPVNTVPGAQSIDRDGMLVFSTATGTAITVTDVDAGTDPLQVTLSATNGTLNLSGTTGLSFITGNGTANASMSFTATIADINQALEGATFVATPGFTGAAGVQIITDDLGSSGTGGAQSDTDAVAITVQTPEQKLWLTFENNQGATGNGDIPSLTGGDVVTFGDVTQLETSNTVPTAATTAGTFAYQFNLDTVKLSDGVTQASDGSTRVSAVHYVTRDIQVGTNTVQLLAGDLVLATDAPESIGGVTYEKEDVFVFRPDTAGDYSQGSFFRLMDGKFDLGWGKISGISLVEQATEIAPGVTLNAGEFLVAHDGSGKNILRYTPGTLGNTSSGSTNVLIDGAKIGIGVNIGGLHLVQKSTVMGGVTLSAGQLLISIQGNDTAVGDAPTIDVKRQDIVALDVSVTGPGSSAATASRLFEGLDQQLDSNPESIWGMALQGNAAPTINTATFGVDENSSPGTVVGTVSAVDPENAALRYAIIAGNDGGAFAIDTSSGQITVANSAALDFESTPSFNLTIAAIDDQGAYGTATITVDLNNVNDAPVAVNDAYNVNEDQVLTVESAINSGLSGWWELNEGAGSQTLSDSSGNGNTGTLGDSAAVEGSDPAWTTSTRTGNPALDFDGSTDYVQTSGTNLQTAMNFTLSVWFQADTTTGQHHILWQGKDGENGWGNGGGTASTTPEMHLSIGDPDTDNKITFFMGWDWAFADAIVISSATDFTDTAGWHQATVVVSDIGGGALDAKLYVDGQLEGSDTGTQIDRSGWDTELRIGHGGNTGRYFDGRIDEVRVYDRELTPAEISMLWTETDGVLLNDSDADSDSLSAVLVSGPSNGSLSFNANGSFEYTPDADFFGVDTFTYKASDGALDSNTATVTITVQNVDDAPTGAPVISGTPTEDQILTADTSGIGDADGVGAYSYQWLRNGADIGGATGSSYTLGDADVGTNISVRVSYIDGGSKVESLTSATVGPVANVNDSPTGSPTITGTATEDQILSADTSGIGDADGLGAYSYQWLRNGADIGGATGSSYTLGDADVGTNISVRVSYTDGHGTGESLTSATVGPVANVNDTPTGSPSVTGTPTEDQILSADTSGIGDADGVGAYSYQWLRNGADIGGATGSSYTLGDADVGTNISVRVSYTDGQGTGESLTSATVGPVANVNDSPTGSPTITGTPTEDQILTADTSGIGDADGLGAYSYQWLRNGADIGGATGSSYTLGDADVGTNISVRVSYTDGQGTGESLTSATVGPVANVNDSPTGSPSVTGTPTEDQVLSADTSSIGDADGVGAYSYQWLRNGADIGGATGSSYTLGDADVGTNISVRVSYTDGQGTGESLTSATVGPVANVNDTPTGSPSITGTPTEDQMLTADTSGIGDADGLGAYSYQWLRNGADIGGATGSSYTLGDADVGTNISVRVSYTDGQGTGESLTSAMVGPVANVNDTPTGSLTITGTATEDQMLSADTSGIGDADGLGAYSYQWLRNGADIGGATGNSYTLGDADVGTNISVRVSYTDGQGTGESLTSATVGPIANVNDSPTGSPNVTGTPTEDQILTADTSGIGDADGLGAYSYQWLRNGADIGGATGSSYTLGDADVGTNISVRVSYTDGQGTGESLTSATVGPVANVNDAPTGSPNVTGTPTEDQILTADTSGIGDADGLGAYSYQWLRNGADIGGATGSSYTLGDADVGTNISVRVSYTDGQGTGESLTSATVGPVANVNDSPTGSPSITGTLTEDQILTADTSGIGDADGLGAYSYQWLRNGADIGGATGSSYTLGDADVGTNISVRVSYTDGQGTGESLTSATVGPVANVNDSPTGSPSITGTPTEDQILTADTSGIGDADGLGAYSYQWLRNGADIGGATGSSYTLGDADVGTNISVRVSYTDGQGTGESLTSATVGPVANVNDAPTGSPTITGTPTEDQILTADTSGIGDADGLGAYSYQWLRNGADIGGATGSSYTLGDADVGTNISVRVSYTDGQGTGESLTSATVGPVANVNDSPTGSPSITGTPTEDQILTADTSGIGDADGLGAYSYQWLRNGADIGGATGSSYTLGDADVGTNISVRVSYTDGQGTGESLTSATVGPVANVNDNPTGSPSITGTATEDQILSADTSGIGDADGLGAYSYQWLRNGADIGGATGSSYTLGDADVGANISVRVSYTDGQGTGESLTSAMVGPVANVNDTPTGSLTITGTATEDQMLSADTSGIGDADGLGAYSYQWLRNGAGIGGATGSSYTLGDADVGTNISVRVSYTDGQGTGESLTSATVGPVANVNDIPSGLPLVSGTASEDELLVAQTMEITDADGIGEFSYQWLRDGQAIANANEASYKLTRLDAGARISVQVSYADGHGTLEGPLLSAPSAEVAAIPVDETSEPTNRTDDPAARPPLDAVALSAVLAPPAPGPSLPAEPQAQEEELLFAKLSDSDGEGLLHQVAVIMQEERVASGESERASTAVRGPTAQELLLAEFYNGPSEGSTGNVYEYEDNGRGALLSDALQSDIDQMGAQLDSSVEREVDAQTLRKNVIQVTLGTLSAGSVTWLLRLGSLMTGVFSSIPLWSSVDPLPILYMSRKEKHRRQKESQEVGRTDLSERRMEQLVNADKQN